MCRVNDCLVVREGQQWWDWCPLLCLIHRGRCSVFFSFSSSQPVASCHVRSVFNSLSNQTRSAWEEDHRDKHVRYKVNTASFCSVGIFQSWMNCTQSKSEQNSDVVKICEADKWTNVWNKPKTHNILKKHVDCPFTKDNVGKMEIKKVKVGQTGFFS